MSVRYQIAGLCVAMAVVAQCCTASAQYSRIAAGRTFGGDSFFENIGVGFAGQFGNGGFFNFGGPAPPPFGGGNDGGGANFGFGGRNWRLNLYADQGSSRTLSSDSASVTIPNGGFGSIFSGSVRPFVTGIVPVVGQASPVLERYNRLLEEGGGLKEYAERHAARYQEPVTEEPQGLRLGASSAERGDASVADIRRQQALEDAQLREEMLQLVADADRCISEGKLGAARVYLQQAARRASDSEKPLILSKLESIK